MLHFMIYRVDFTLVHFSSIWSNSAVRFYIFLWIRPYGQVRHYGDNIVYCVRLSVIGVHECKVLLFLPCLRLVMDKTFFEFKLFKWPLHGPLHERFEAAVTAESCGHR